MMLVKKKSTVGHRPIRPTGFMSPVVWVLTTGTLVSLVGWKAWSSAVPRSVEPWLGTAGFEGGSRALLPLGVLASLSAVLLEVARPARTSSIL